MRAFFKVSNARLLARLEKGYHWPRREKKASRAGAFISFEKKRNETLITLN